MRREVRASGVTECARCAQRWSRMTSSELAQFGGSSDDLHLCLCHRRRPPATTSSDSCFLFDYCVLCLPRILFTLKTIWFYAWTRSSYISLLHAYFLHAHWKGNSLIYVVRNYHKKQIIYVRKCQICTFVPNSRMFIIIIKNQIKSLMFVNVRFLRLP
jgi:hypothetical protein